MTEKQIRQCKACLPKGQTMSRAYSAFEGGVRFISVDRNGKEYRYKVIFDTAYNASLIPF